MLMNGKTTAAMSPAPYETPADWKRARQILAKSFYTELKGNGLTSRQIIELSNELLTLVSDDFARPAERAL